MKRPLYTTLNESTVITPQDVMNAAHDFLTVCLAAAPPRQHDDNVELLANALANGIGFLSLAGAIKAGKLGGSEDYQAFISELPRFLGASMVYAASNLVDWENKPTLEDFGGLIEVAKQMNDGLLLAYRQIEAHREGGASNG